MKFGARIYCPLRPCLPHHDGPIPNAETVRESLSFSDFDAYYRHMTRGHFIPRTNAPLPFTLEDREREVA